MPLRVYPKDRCLLKFEVKLEKELLNSPTTVDEWQDLSSSLVVPSGTTNVQVGVEVVVGSSPVGAVYFDDLQMSFTGGTTE